MNDSMFEFLRSYRSDAEAHWDEETISPKFLPVDLSRPRSLGQCAATSRVLLDRLREAFVDERFALAIGEVWVSGRKVIPYHVWVMQEAESPRHNRVIDVTSDQSEALEPIVYATVAELSERDIVYAAYETSADARFMHAEAAKRAALLRSRL